MNPHVKQIQQLLDCDKALFTQASHTTMGKLTAVPPAAKPLDEAIKTWKASQEILQYLTPLPATKSHEPPPAPVGSRPAKQQKTDKPKGGGKLHRQAVDQAFQMIA